jgi:hypothetical protein
MKRLFIVLVVLTMIASFSFAEEIENVFEFRNGVRFGDTREEIRGKEPHASIPMEFDASTLTYSGLVFSGIKKSNLTYYFANEKLYYIEIQYYANAQPKEDFIKDFDTIDEGLTRKYGDAISNPADYVILDDGVITEKRYSDPENIVKMSQRLVPYGDNVVVIDHIVCLNQHGNPIHLLSYLQVPKDFSKDAFVDADL